MPGPRCSERPYFKGIRQKVTEQHSPLASTHAHTCAYTQEHVHTLHTGTHKNKPMLSGRAGRMAQLVTALAAEPDNLSLCWKEQPTAFSHTAYQEP